MRTRQQALLDWFHGRTGPMPQPDTDLGQAFIAGWNALASETEVSWFLERFKSGTKIVSLMPPGPNGTGIRYAGYYCEDMPEPPVPKWRGESTACRNGLHGTCANGTSCVWCTCECHG